MKSGLSDAFIAALSPEHRARFTGFPLEEMLAERLAEARAAHPTVAVDAGRFAASLAAGAPEPAALLGLSASDLYLALGCAAGDPEALRIFTRQYGPDLDRAVARSPSLGLSAAELSQLVCERLFVATPGAAPRVARYRGEGSLRGFVRVVATRLIIDLSRKTVPPAGDDQLLATLPGATDPELDYLRHAYGALVPPAFEAALASLAVRDRNLLRQRFLHELTVEQLATLYGVHRSTIFEWLKSAHGRLLSGLRRALAASVGAEELDSVVALLGSRLELSVRRMLDSRLEEER
jgi:RNA polymerase sigma-70 factor, ECF subfamily